MEKPGIPWILITSKAGGFENYRSIYCFNELRAFVIVVQRFLCDGM